MKVLRLVIVGVMLAALPVGCATDGGYAKRKQEMQGQSAHGSTNQDNPWREGMTNIG